MYCSKFSDKKNVRLTPINFWMSVQEPNISSIFAIASIALLKLLSPSHSAHSVSLFSDFTQWCADSEIELMGFKGFQANRFGRIASNAKTFLEYETAITEFFEEVIDDSVNKLVTACAVKSMFLLLS